MVIRKWIMTQNVSIFLDLRVLLFVCHVYFFTCSAVSKAWDKLLYCFQIILFILKFSETFRPCTPMPRTLGELLDIRGAQLTNPSPVPFSHRCLLSRVHTRGKSAWVPWKKNLDPEKPHAGYSMWLFEIPPF